MKKLLKWSTTITKLEDTYGVDAHKIHLLGIAEKAWTKGGTLRVTDLMGTYQGASRATTHKAIKDLIDQELFRVVGSDDDKRIRFLHPGKKLPQLEKLL